MKKIDGHLEHALLLDSVKPKFSLKKGIDLEEHKKALKEKFIELSGYDKVVKNAVPLKIEIEQEVDKGEYRQIRFVFESEKGAFVPCYLLIPKGEKKKYPVAITMQGHSTGFHNSIGEPKDDEDAYYALTRGQFAVQAVKNGYIALAIEQRAMGERMTTRHSWGYGCTFPSLVAISLGRTVIAERIFDITRAIDALSYFSECDLDKIFITGNSGGGTISYYAPIIEERIRFTAPSCAVCSYKTSILDIHHCPCNYIPSCYEWFEMQDLAILFAPRPIIVITGKDDKIFPLNGVKEAFKTIRLAYEMSGKKDNCELVVTDKGHWWCEDLVWNAINAMAKKLNF